MAYVRVYFKCRLHTERHAGIEQHHPGTATRPRGSQTATAARYEHGQHGTGSKRKERMRLENFKRDKTF